MRQMLLFGAAALALLQGSAALAAETLKYTYDARGRLVKVVREGGPANGATTQYAYDAADNRTSLTSTVPTVRQHLVIFVGPYPVIVPR